MRNDSIQKCLKIWREEICRIENLKDELNRVECARANARNALGKLLVPDDACIDECFYIWVDDDGENKLLEVKLIDAGTYGIRWRQ